MVALVAQVTEQFMAQAARVIVGQERVLRLTLCCFLSDGHLLLEGVPGTAKTLLAKTLAHLVQGGFKRVQFTPDLMPSDVLGTLVFNLESGKFHLKRGPVFTNVLLGDEINRAPAKTQSALLECMEERQVTIDGRRYPLGDPFMVVATQNPIEFEGTYPLPEAQLDRFLMSVVVPQPELPLEVEILQRHHQGFSAHKIEELRIEAVLLPDQLGLVRQAIQGVTVEPGVLEYMARICQATRSWPDVSFGAGTRAAIALLKGSKALAAMSGRDFVQPDDVKSLVGAICRHRLILTPEAEIEGQSVETVLDEILEKVDVPR